MTHAIEVRAKEADAEAAHYVDIAADAVIDSKEKYEVAAELVKELAHKWKLLDQERTVSVKPLNDEVRRINEWFKPGLTKLKTVEEKLRKLMGDFVLRSKQEEARLAAAAAAAAKAALATSAAPMQEAQQLMQQAAASSAPDVKGVSAKVRWTWTVKDATKLPEQFTKRVPDEDALNAWVAAHGDKDVPPGLEVVPDVRFTVRGR